MIQSIVTVLLLLLPVICFAAGGESVSGAHLDGSSMSVFWVIPFAGLLGSIAFIPLWSRSFWHAHYGKISAFWAVLVLLSLMWSYPLPVVAYEFFHVMGLEYLPFIILLGTLFIITGGIELTGTLKGTPVGNFLILLFGTAIASWIGTTGAAMLLIRPLIRANQWRQKKAYIVVFFIFLVANIGGALTPLGDPPLFLGFLKGVNFFWTTTHLFWPMVLISSILLGLFFIIDQYFYKKEPASKHPNPKHIEPIGIVGKHNIVLLVGVVLLVLMSGLWDSRIVFHFGLISIELQSLVRDLGLILLSIISLKTTSKKIYVENGFTWFPIVEVSKLFAGIFITIIPVVTILKAGLSGPLKPLIEVVQTSTGDPINTAYFWVTGIHSSLLDNAPSYLIFFNAAGGDALILMTTLSKTLLAISLGAVFMGGLTYIGNAPNFMILAIAEEHDIDMPSFFGYVFKYSVPILVPLFILIGLIFL